MLVVTGLQVVTTRNISRYCKLSPERQSYHFKVQNYSFSPLIKKGPPCPTIEGKPLIFFCLLTFIKIVQFFILEWVAVFYGINQIPKRFEGRGLEISHMKIMRTRHLGLINTNFR